MLQLPCTQSSGSSGTDTAIAMDVLGQGSVSLRWSFLEGSERLELTLVVDEANHVFDADRSDQLIFQVRLAPEDVISVEEPFEEAQFLLVA